jgi:nucleotide-binding universal stress UspA family protein
MPDNSRYKTIGVASTFSPRFRQVLAEAKRIRERFRAELHLIYAGKRSEEAAAKFREALEDLQLTREKIDVIVAGALEKEVVLHPFLGNVARRLVQEAPCSVMLFTKPAANPNPLRRMVFVADFSSHGLQALQRTLQLAAAESCERLYVISIITTFDQARASIRADTGQGEKPQTRDEEEEALEQFALAAGETDVPMEARCIRGNTGLIVSDFVESIKADLLVVPLRKNGKASQPLPGNIAWVTDVIPCNLWLIR